MSAPSAAEPQPALALLLEILAQHTPMYFLAPHSRTPLPPCLAHRYALFYLLREIGSLRGPMGEFIDSLRAAGSPSQQLRLLNAYRPAELAAVGAGEEHWDAAVYSTLDRATLLKRLLRGAAYGGSAAGSGSSTPSSSSVASSSSGVGGMPAFGGPVAAVLPRDRLGAMMLEATRRQLQRPGSDATPGGVLHVPLEARHTECLLSEQGWQATAVALAEAVRAVLPLL